MKNLSNKTVVITGARGLIGSALVDSLITNKCKIIAIDKLFENSDLVQEYLIEKIMKI